MRCQDPRPLITPAHREKWDAEGDTFDVITRARDRCGRDEHARHRSQQSEFVVEPADAEVVLDRFTPGITLVGGARVDVSENAPNDFPVIGD